MEYNSSMREKKRIVVAMSGGVDSSAAAALLKAQGFEVIGITLRLWAPSEWNDGDKFGSCCSPRDIADAKDVCRKLDIPHYTMNLEGKFQDAVVDNFVSEYEAGRTPNPCVRCNAFVKFDTLLKYAVAMNADYLTTGHYAKAENGRLFKAKDPAKDQSYFLYMLGQRELPRLLFPLGNFTKDEVRRAAEDAGLSNAGKPDSQDVCFLEGRDYREFIKERMSEGAQKGMIKTMDGKVIGEHAGLPFYTIGQRGGLGIATGERTYVLNKESESNTLVVGAAEETLVSSCRLKSVSWCSGSAPENIKASVKIRYRHPGAESRVVSLSPNEAQVEFEVPQSSVAPGQSAVFYDGDEVLGGGVIDDVRCS